MTDAPKTTFLPNLVGGVSIWKLARDLNEEKFFDKRLLVPETEGADSLPVTVRWKLEGLLPLREARGRFPAESQKAIEDFVACVKKVAAEFDDPKSGYSKYKQALTVPALDAAADNYFYDPDTKKLSVINWGASPRAIGGNEEFVFGYGSFDKLFAGAAVAGTAGAVAGAVTAAPAPAAPAEAEKKPDEKKPEEKKEKKPGALLWGRPWWVWLLVLLAILLILGALLFLLKDCNAPWDHPDAGSDAAAEGGVDAAADGAAADAGADAAASDAGEDAGEEVKDAGAEAGDASADAGKDAGADAGKDAGKDGGDKSADGSGDGDGDGPGGVGGPGGPGGIGIGGAGGKIRVVPGGPLVPVDRLPHRAHFHPDALRWKVASGEPFLAAGSPKTGEGQHFDVVLKPGNTFEQVTVLWQDRKGGWHQ